MTPDTRHLTPDNRRRYARHILIPEIGETGQEKLLASSVLVIGAGGLGAAALSYLAAAGIGRIGIVDHDHVELSNLNRQIIHESGDIGRKKVESAADRISEINPECKVETFAMKINEENISFLLPPRGGADEARPEAEAESWGGKRKELKHAMVKNAHQLRKNSTDAEKIMWGLLSRKQLEGFKFRRQEPIDKYIADFVCYELRLIIELDGGQHNQESNIKKDQERTAFLESQGFKIIRYWNNDVLGNIEGTIDNLLSQIAPSPNPLPQGERVSSLLPPRGGADEARPEAEAESWGGRRWQVVLDGSDNFPTRFAINAACHAAHIPLISGAVRALEGQISTFKSYLGAGHPCYRCLVPDLPPDRNDCAENGILGPIVGVIGSLMAVEAIKELLGIGESLSGKLLRYSALSAEWKKGMLGKDPSCPLCSK